LLNNFLLIGRKRGKEKGEVGKREEEEVHWSLGGGGWG